MAVDKILDDDREISMLAYEDDSGVRVGQGGVTRIVAYGEPGVYCDQPWFAVYESDHLAARYAATQGMVVIYKTPEKDKDE